MNYFAYKVIKRELKERPGKYIAVMGANHIQEIYSGVKGVADLLECPQVIITDNPADHTEVNRANYLVFL